MCSHGDFASIWDTFTCWLWKRVLNRSFLENGLTKIFRVCNFGYKLAVTIILFFKKFKIWCRFQKWNKKVSKIFRLTDSCILIGSGKFSQCLTWYLASSVNVPINTHKVSPNTRGDIFQINFPENDEKTWEKRSHGDFTSIWDAFTCWLRKPVLKHCSLESVLTNFFTGYNSGNTLAMTIIFLFKMFKNGCRFQNWNKKLRKSFSFFG